jgi:type I restriction enzyme, S subunit
MKATWEMKKLGEICEERKEKNINNENLPVFTVSHIYGLIPYQNIFYKQVHSKDTKNYKIVNRYDFAFGLPTKDTLPYGLLERKDKVLVSPAYIVFAIKDKNLLFPRFLYYLLKTDYYKWEIIEMAKSQGATRHGLPLKFHHLANLEIPLPPLPIQQKIVKILDTIQEAVEVQEKIIEKTKELKKSLMAELFKYGGPSFRKGRKLKKTEIGEIPEDWEVVRIKDVGSVITGTTPSTSVKEFWDGDIPFVTPSDFKNDSVYVYQTGRKVTSAGAQKGRIIPKNSILVVCIGSTLGKIALSYEECITNQQINAIICENFKVNPFFVYYFLLKNQGLLKAYAGTTTKPIVKKSLFETFLIPLPSLLEQQEIAEILQTIDQKIEIEKRKKELYEELFKTMLNKIMNQEIDVEKIEV